MEVVAETSVISLLCPLGCCKARVELGMHSSHFCISGAWPALP